MSKIPGCYVQSTKVETGDKTAKVTGDLITRRDETGRSGCDVQ